MRSQYFASSTTRLHVMDIKHVKESVMVTFEFGLNPVSLHSDMRYNELQSQYHDRLSLVLSCWPSVPGWEGRQLNAPSQPFVYISQRSRQPNQTSDVLNHVYFIVTYTIIITFKRYLRCLDVVPGQRGRWKNAILCDLLGRLQCNLARY